MSLIAVRAALETKLAAMTPALSTASENVPFTPVAGTPFQAAYFMPSVDNPTMGDGFYRILGIFQVSLFYPLNTGSGTAAARTEAIKTAFKRGTTLTSGTVTVKIDRTPEISQGRVEGDRWHIPIKISFTADITT